MSDYRQKHQQKTQLFLMKDHLNLFQPGKDTFYHRDSITRDSLVGIGLTTKEGNGRNSFMYQLLNLSTALVPPFFY